MRLAMIKNLCFAALLALLVGSPLAAADDEAKPKEPAIPEAKTWVTKHKITIDRKSTRLNSSHRT